VLDGGHVFMALIEIIFRRPLPVIIVKVLSYLFVGLLILLMLYVTYMDVMRVMPAKAAQKELPADGKQEKPAAGKVVTP
jgi:hypothetical protein